MYICKIAKSFQFQIFLFAWADAAAALVPVISFQSYKCFIVSAGRNESDGSYMKWSFKLIHICIIYIWCLPKQMQFGFEEEIGRIFEPFPYVWDQSHFNTTHTTLQATFLLFHISEDNNSFFSFATRRCLYLNFYPFTLLIWHHFNIQWENEWKGELENFSCRRNMMTM